MSAGYDVMGGLTGTYGPDGTVLNYEESKKADEDFWASVEREKVSLVS